MADAISNNEVTYVVWDDGLPMVQFGEKPRYARSRSRAAARPEECEEPENEGGNSPEPFQDAAHSYPDEIIPMELHEGDNDAVGPGPLSDLPGEEGGESVRAMKAAVAISSDEEDCEDSPVWERYEASSMQGVMSERPSSSASKIPFVPAPCSSALAVIVFIRIYIYILRLSSLYYMSLQENPHNT